MKHAKFLKNAAAISLAGIAAKAIGALYRIPLTAMLGGYGMGLYQMAYPLFCVLLTFSSAGIPSALARMIASDGDGVARNALRLFAVLGGIGSAAMCLLAPAMSKLQGDPALVRCYFALAPSVFLVALIAVFRGLFQGKNDMRPTALSEILEQLVKAAAGLFLARFALSPQDRAACALFAVTLSELAALFFLMRRHKRTRRVLLARERTGSEVLISALPVMTAAALLPLSRMADSVLVVRLLSRHTDRAVGLYGLLSGAASSLCSLPATLCYGLVAATVPLVSRGEEGERGMRAAYALLVTLLLSLPLSLGLLLFARPIVSLLYPALSAADRATLTLLVRTLSLSSVFLAGTDTLAASLTGMGRAKKAAFSMGVAVLVKLCLELLLVNGRLLALGAAAAESACYPVAFFLDLMYTIRKKKVKDHDNRHRIGHGAGGPQPECAEDPAGSRQSGAPHGERPRRRDLARQEYPL